MFFGGGSFIFLIFVFGLGPTQSSDFLDMVPTASYWEAKKVAPNLEQLQADAGPEKPPVNVEKLVQALSSDDFKTRSDAQKELERMGPAVTPLLKPALESKDPEVAAVANNLVKQFTDKGRDRAVRRLMAIRTLGERKEKAAIPTLKLLADSKDPFVADYALRAIANIEGKKIPPVDHKKEILADVNLLPKDTAIIVQATGLTGEAFVLDKITDLMLDPKNQNPMMGFGGDPGDKLPDKKKVLSKLTGHFLEALDRVGNVRIDGTTLAIGEQTEDQSPWVIIALRGKYDPAAMAAVAKAANDENIKTSREGKIDIVEIPGDTTFILPSNEQLIIVYAEDEQRPALTKKIVATLNGGKPEFAENKELAGLVKTLDTAGPVWGAAKLSKDMRKEKAFEAYEAITLATKLKDDIIDFTFTAHGTDAEKMKESGEALTTGIKAMTEQMRPMIAQMKGFQPYIDVLESLKVTPKGMTGTMTGQLKTTILQTTVAGYAPFLLMMMREDFEEEVPMNGNDAGAGIIE